MTLERQVVSLQNLSVDGFMESISEVIGARMSKKGYIFSTLTIVALAIMLVVLFSQSSQYTLSIDGQYIGVIQDKALLDKTLEELRSEQEALAQISLGHYTNTIELEKVKDRAKKNLDLNELKKVLSARIDWTVLAAAIQINDQPRVYLQNLEDCRLVLDKLKEKFSPDAEDSKILSVDFEEKIDLINTETNLSNIKEPAEALNLIINGTDKLETYKVKKGDTLWDIALENNISVSELKEANPQLKKDVLSISQELNLVKREPLINIVTAFEVTKDEKVNFQTKYEDSSALWKGQSQVKQKGINGKSKITYKIVRKNDLETEREILAEQVLEKPVTQVVQRGTQVMVASRGGGGSGRLAWPFRGTLTSPYGQRGKEFHTGMDIAGSLGSPIFSAEKGKVIYAAWRGNYGYCIDIDHGDGLLTRYAHLSKIEVSVGNEVTRGEQIGKVGSTGRSTGPHLHFEVRVNGNHLNPLRYLD